MFGSQGSECSSLLSSVCSHVQNLEDKDEASTVKVGVIEFLPVVLFWGHLQLIRGRFIWFTVSVGSRQLGTLGAKYFVSTMRGKATKTMWFQVRDSSLMFNSGCMLKSHIETELHHAPLH